MGFTKKGIPLGLKRISLMIAENFPEIPTIIDR
jgi:hypothetical protein